MKKINYFEDELLVHFTLIELLEISSALATESFEESDAGRKNNSARAWKLREKVLKFYENYKKVGVVLRLSDKRL